MFSNISNNKPHNNLITRSAAFILSLLRILLLLALCSVMAANVVPTAVANSGMDAGRGRGSRLARQKRDCNRSNCHPGFCLLGQCTAG
uniref:Uncharacterized protein n=1 Tax=Globodera rostochiensis TaxID=31243 RepID=A0A914GU33_GLORO